LPGEDDDEQPAETTKTTISKQNAIHEEDDED
jgi:hypothetical protein